MKAYLHTLLEPITNPLLAGNVMREYLQARILACLQRSGAMIPLAFQGGTALRFLYSLPRHSEGLDFSLEGDPETYELQKYAQILQTEFTREGYKLQITHPRERAVHQLWIKFVGLLHEMQLSPHPAAVFSIKMEIDTKPPAGAGLATTLIRRHVMLQLQHYDRPSLLAGKIHALLQRPYTKGRDLYDLIWYLSDPGWPPPNLVWLNNALNQTDLQGAQLTETTWKNALMQKIQHMDLSRARADVLPFLENPAEGAFITRDNLLHILS